MFHHPSEKCPYFPKCMYGDSCMYIHPSIQCKFAEGCTRPDCAYVHPRVQPFQYPTRYMGRGRGGYHHQGMRGGRHPKFVSPHDQAGGSTVDSTQQGVKMTENVVEATNQQ